MPPDPFLDAIVEAVMEMIQSGEHIPDEILEQIADIINNHNLAVNPPVVAPEQVPNVEPAQMASSNIYGFAYDDKNKRLMVKFQGNDGYGQGSVYAYGGVPREIFDVFKKGAVPARTDGSNKWGSWWRGKVPSLGASFHTLIKEQNYPYEKVS